MPLTDDSPIVRYLSLAKLVNLLTTKEMYFCRLDGLKPFDPWEGAAAAQMAVATPMDPSAPEIEVPVPENELDGVTRLVRAAMEFQAQQGVFVSCWHQSEMHSAAMWSRYSNLEEGVCVKTTVGRLRTALVGSPYDVEISEVEYIDRAVTHWWGREIFLCKHQSFASEREVRAWIALDEADPNRSKAGLRIPVSLSDLLVGIDVSPVAHDWVALLIETLLSSGGVSHVASPPQTIPR